jgi:hypothetical protein
MQIQLSFVRIAYNVWGGRDNTRREPEHLADALVSWKEHGFLCCLKLLQSAQAD